MRLAKSLKHAILPITLFLSGCETFEEEPYYSFDEQTLRIMKFSVSIISEPSGARIEVNNNYIGKTPINAELEGWETTRTFARSHTIVAHPLKDGGETQVKFFTGWSEPSETYGDIIPDAVFFNMNLVSVPEKYDINLNKQGR